MRSNRLIQSHQGSDFLAKGKARKNPPGRKYRIHLGLVQGKFGLLTQMQEMQYTVSQENSEKKSGEGGFPQGQKSQQVSSVPRKIRMD